MKITTEITWIPVGESLPDADCAVLVATQSGEVGQGFLNGEQWCWCDGGVEIDDDPVTHWGELPKHPTACHLDDPEMAQVKRMQQPKVGDKFTRENSKALAIVKAVSANLVEVEHEDGNISRYTPAEFSQCALRTVSHGAIFTPAPEA